MTFQFAHPWYMLIAGSLLGIAVIIQKVWSQPNVYVYPLAHYVAQNKLKASLWYAYFFYALRMLILLLMISLIGKPQFVDKKSKVSVEGIDIVLALDMSQSMNLFDDERDRRSRWTIAKQEALNFIDKRENDALGLVIFGRYAIARCPITADKNVLKSIISELRIGMPSHDMQFGTMLSQALVTAARRLQKSQAKSKVIVLLTDGEPTQGDVAPKDAIDLVKKLGIKVYTIGVGGDHGGMIEDTIFGVQRVGGALNKTLLRQIAHETGGQFFEAKKSDDLKKIYDKIDTLEKVSYETEVFNKYHDYFMPLLLLVVWLILFELFMASVVWFIL